MVISRLVLFRALVVALLVGSVLWAYFPILAEMADKWISTPDYSHGYLVPAFSVYLLWHFRKTTPLIGDRPAWLSGGAFLLVGLALRLVGAFFFVSWLEAISLLAVLWGAGLLMGGWPAFRWSWLAIGFLIFMIPLPHRAETTLSQPLQNLATYASTYVLQTLGWPAFREGNVILLNEHRIGIVTACNGLGMLILFFALSAAVALLVQRPWLDRVVILLSAIPIALLSNVIRIVVTSILYEVGGQRLGDLLFHDLAGWVMMPLALGMLWLELRVLSWLLVAAPREVLPDLDFSSAEDLRFQHART
jgi:exosortase